MDQTQNSPSTPFIDYVPAELHENKVWEIVYYVVNPITGKLARKRNRVRPMGNKTERRKLAKRMILVLNERLARGWNPFYQERGTRELTPLTKAGKVFLERIKKDVADGNLRYDTLKTYRSQINKLNTYLEVELKKPELLCYEFNAELVGDYLDFIRYEKRRSSRTRNNCLSFLKLFSSFLLRKKYIAFDPTQTFSKTKNQNKKRVVIDIETRDAIFMYWQNENAAYLVLCMVAYYCLIRPTEATKIKVGDVDLENALIWVDSRASKNKKENGVTIPNALIPYLSNHMDNAAPDDYLFSDNFAPGSKRIWTQRIGEFWDSMRKELGIKDNVHFYSLKDSGITHLLEAGVPLIMVRDQARHHHSSQTDVYTPRTIRKSNEHIKTVKL